MLIGLTNMPPMANGGMQRGVYGRAESPYNAEWLTAPFASGSSLAPAALIAPCWLKLTPRSNRSRWPS